MNEESDMSSYQHPDVNRQKQNPQIRNYAPNMIQKRK